MIRNHARTIRRVLIATVAVGTLVALNPTPANAAVGTQVPVKVKPFVKNIALFPSRHLTVHFGVYDTEGFDTTLVDLDSIRAGITGTEASPVGIRLFRDPKTQGEGHILWVNFDVDAMGVTCGTTTLTITGNGEFGFWWGTGEVVTKVCGPVGP